MNKVLIDRALAERVCRVDNSTRQTARRELRTILATPSGTPAMPVKAYYHEAPNEYGGLNKSVGLEVRKEFADAPLVLESDALTQIACLEGEIAKRDEELAACRVAVENCEVFRARIAELEHRCGMYGLELTNEVERRLQAERQLSALKAQEPVAEIALSDDGYKIGLLGALRNHRLPIGTKLYAAPVSEAKRSAAEMFSDVLMCQRNQVETLAGDPYMVGLYNGMSMMIANFDDSPDFERLSVSEAKAQGVVQWPEADEIMQMAFEEGHPADDASGYYFELEEFDLFIERLMSEVARLNAAPVQQVSVPDGWRDGYRAAMNSAATGARQLYVQHCHHHGVNGLLDRCKELEQSFIRDADALLTASPAAPAADAGLVEALDYQVLFDAIAAATSVYANGAVNISVQAFRDALAAHRSTGVV